MAYQGQNEFGAFFGTTNVWDVNEIISNNDIPSSLRDLLVRLYQNLNNTSVLLNIKDSGFYNTMEFVNSQLFFPNTTNTTAFRQVYRLVVNFGALPNTATKSVAHGLAVNSSWTFTRIYGTATQPNTEFIPLPYASTVLANTVELWVDPTNVNVRTAADYTAYTTTYIILEYLKF